MIDVHSHILPMLDDGAASVEESIAMLLESKQNNVTTVIATPHCYARHESDIAVFLEKREASYKLLKDAISNQNDELPEVKLGCELHVECDVSKFSLLDKLAIVDSNYILTEMPFDIWNNNLIDIIYDISARNLRPVMAHIDRFFMHKHFFKDLFEMNLVYQVNADSIINPKMNHVINYLFKNAMVQVIGSDMHNTSHRPTKILQASERIKKLYGEKCVDYLNQNAEKLLKNENIGIRDFKKKNILKRIF